MFDKNDYQIAVSWHKSSTIRARATLPVRQRCWIETFADVDDTSTHQDP